jgi:BolA protein
MEVQKELEEKLAAELSPTFLELVNESYMHSVPEGSESHFKATIVSDSFSGKRLVQQHQLVYAALGDSMDRIHALALHTYTPEEWQQRGASPQSPDCKGGSKAG